MHGLDANRGTALAKEGCMRTNPTAAGNSHLDRALELGITKCLCDARRLL